MEKNTTECKYEFRLQTCVYKINNKYNMQKEDRVEVIFLYHEQMRRENSSLEYKIEKSG